MKEFKERMAIVPLRIVGGEGLMELAKDNEAVFVLSADVSSFLGVDVHFYVKVRRSSMHAPR